MYIDRFSKFYRRLIQQQVSNKVIIRDSTTSQTRVKY